MNSSIDEWINALIHLWPTYSKFVFPTASGGMLVGEISFEYKNVGRYKDNNTQSHWNYEWVGQLYPSRGGDHTEAPYCKENRHKHFYF